MPSYFRKIKAGLVNHPITNFIGEKGNIFFNIDTGELRLSDGVTPGGIPIYMSGGGGAYILPPATNSTLGGVKVGSGLNVAGDGTLSANAYVLMPATVSTLGGIKVGNNLTISPDGTLNANAATNISYGNFDEANDAQSNTYVLRNTTNGAGITELFLDGINQRLVVTQNSVWTYEIIVTAKRTDTNTDAAAFKIIGAVARNTAASSVFMVGTTTSNIVIGRTDSTWDAYTDVDISSGALTVKVKGAMGKTVRWVAKVETTEVNFAD